MALDLGLEFEPLPDGEIEEMKRLAQENRPLFVYPSPNA